MSVDALTEAISWSRISGATFLNSRLRAPWGLRLDPTPGAALHIVSRGRCFLALDGARPVALAEADVVLLPHGSGHRLVSAPDGSSSALTEMVPAACGRRLRPRG
jgi:Cupin